MKPFKEFLCIIISLFLVSYLLNFVWEAFHSVLYLGVDEIPYGSYLIMLHRASSADAALILAMYLLAGALSGNLLWIRRVPLQPLMIMGISGLLIAAFIEYHAVFIAGRWRYSPLMPAFFGIGLTPLVQLSVTGTAAVWLVYRFLYRKIGQVTPCKGP